MCLSHKLSLLLQANRNICCDLGSSLAEATKRSVCTALGCDYDKCDWRNDGYGGSGGGYVSGGGYSDKYKDYDGVYVDLTPKVDYYKEKKIIEVVEEEVVEDVKEEKILTNIISSKVEGYQEESASYDDNDSWGKSDSWGSDGHESTPASSDWKDDGNVCDEVS